MEYNIIKNELIELLKEDLSTIILDGKKPSLISSNVQLFKILKDKYPNILLSSKYLVEICKNKDSIEKCLSLFFCKCGKQKNIKKRFCSDPNCIYKNKSVAISCNNTKLERYGNAKYNNSNKMLNTKLERYGDSKYNNFTKMMQTKLEKYGDMHYHNSNKARETCKNKYNTENYMQTSEFFEKSRKTFNKKYGNENYFATKDFAEKRIATNLKNYGTDSFSKTEEFKEKCKKTWLEHFGTTHPFKNEEVKQKVKGSLLKNWGVDSFSKTEQFRNRFKDEDLIKQMKEKEYQTKKENNSWGNKSQPEDEAYSLIKQKFPDAIHHYYDKRYPYECDIYIPCKDLFIELHYNWTHGGAEFDEKNIEHINKLNKWKIKARSSEYYENAIKNWTIRDLKKLKTLKENKLNYKIFYYEKDFIEWFEKYE